MRAVSPERQLAYEKVTMKQHHTTGQPWPRCSGYCVPHYMMATRRNQDRATAFRVTDAPCSQAAARNEQSPGGSSFRPRSICEDRIGPASSEKATTV